MSRDALDAALHQALARLRELWVGRMRELELTAPQTLALRMLNTAAQPMRNVADHLVCDASTMTGIADRLEERGLIERRGSAEDRRVKLLAITDEGRRLLAAMDRSLVDEIDGLRRLGEADQAQLAELLTRGFTR